MTVLNVLRYPDPHLKTKAAPVTSFDKELNTLVDDMYETMYFERGIGLAATQVNTPKRVIVIDTSEDKSKQLCLINPEILESKGSDEMEEGCISIPGVYEKVKRPTWVKIRAVDKAGKKIEMEADGVLAVCIQHDIDLLDGKVFLEHLSILKRQRALKKYEKTQRQRS